VPENNRNNLWVGTLATVTGAIVGFCLHLFYGWPQAEKVDIVSLELSVTKGKYMEISSEFKDITIRSEVLSSELKASNEKNQFLSSELKTANDKNQSLVAELSSINDKNQYISTELNSINDKYRISSLELSTLTKKYNNATNELGLLNRKLFIKGNPLPIDIDQLELGVTSVDTFKYRYKTEPDSTYLSVKLSNGLLTSCTFYLDESEKKVDWVSCWFDSNARKNILNQVVNNLGSNYSVQEAICTGLEYEWKNVGNYTVTMSDNSYSVYHL